MLRIMPPQSFQLAAIAPTVLSPRQLGNTVLGSLQPTFSALPSLQPRIRVCGASILSCVAFGNSSDVVAVGTDRSVHVLPATPTLVRPGAVHALQQPGTAEAFTRAICFTRSDNYVVSGSEDGLIRVWAWKQTRLRHVFVGHCADVSTVDVALCDPADTVASGSADGTARLWSLSSGKCLATLGVAATAAGTEQRFEVNSVRFCGQDASTLATGGSDGALRLYDVRRATERTAVASHVNAVGDTDRAYMHNPKRPETP